LRKKDAVQHFGTAIALAEALGISSASVSGWGELVPEGRAYQLQVITVGLLRVDPSLYAAHKRKHAA
jgi:DNA-binding transcriptional regulator YdaS (Cro superfamily)